MSTLTLVETIRTVYEDTEELVELIDTETYEGAELHTHLLGLYKAALKAADELERLEAENEQLRQALISVVVEEALNSSTIGVVMRAEENSDD